ncbi:glycosyltransferase, partial [Saccharomonospora halophila]|uniref:glycosyltransferase n=1 Tax=Saccharomonospora halophila TaxID=129922 RepID=UPI0038CD298E
MPAYDPVPADGDALRLRLKRYATERDWLRENNGTLRSRVDALEEENATLRAHQSALAQKVIGRYRGMIERVAPRGTIRRDLYESALGRPKGVAPAPRLETGPVTVPTSAEPVVSVIIPVYGKWPWTRRCLASIARRPPVTPFEVIVVDDASPDDTAERIASCAGVRLVRTERNGGFIGACNLGAGHARGELLMFLNNDTEVHDGWLDESAAVLRDDSGIGLVGSKLVYPNGTLQECGGIVWADGSGSNYGRGSPADEPRFATLRDVDYCSGAALLVRGDVFETVGGFDPRYAPAYYEDTDLAFAVRAAGYRTVVQPASVVIHDEGVSNGTDTARGVKRYQRLNRTVFAEKWAHALVSHRARASRRNLWAARSRTAQGHDGGFVVVADHRLPRTDEDSGSVRMMRILELLVRLDQRVVFFPGDDDLADLRYAGPLYRAGVTIVGDRRQQEDFVRDVGPEIRLAVLSRPQVAWQWLEPLREHAPDCTIAYDTVDLHHVRLGRHAELARSLDDTVEADSLRRRAEALRQLELGLARACDVTFTVSDTERDLLAVEAPEARVEVLSNVHDVDPAPASPRGRSGVLFVGGFDHRPNRDAACWLVEEVMPEVRERYPDAVVHIVGSNPPPEVLDLGSTDADDGSVVVHGWVDDLATMYDGARAVVAPLRFGAGVKGKVGEAMAHGVPVAATTVAVEGMGLVDGADVLVGDTAGLLADRIATLLDDDGVWRRLSDAGKRAVDARFGPEVAGKTLAALLPGAGEQRRH